MPAPAVSIVVLNWNRREETLACLASVQQLRYPRFEVVVVDNASRDDSVAAIRARHPEATLIETGDNLGYTGGNNIALRRAQAAGADYALLLNNDVEVAPDCLQLMIDAAESDPSIAMAGPTVYYYERPELIWSAGGVIDWKHGVTRMAGVDEHDDGQFGDQPRPVDFVSGCALLIKLPVVQRIGLLDDRFFAYYEETEWCARAARHGYRTVHVPRARVWHKVLPHQRAESRTVRYYMTRNRLLFLKCVDADWQVWVRTLVLDYLRVLLGWNLRRSRRSQRDLRDAMVWAIFDYFAGRLGRASRPLDSAPRP